MQCAITQQILWLALLPQVTDLQGFRSQTYTGEECTDQCLKRGHDYYWCHTIISWGHCSPFNDVSSSGKVCKKRHHCLFTYLDSKHMKCKLEEGGYDHCGLNRYVQEVQSISTTYQLFCMDECSKRGSNYYWCNTIQGWDYCSPARDLTIGGSYCRQDHYCERHDYDYQWCYTSDSWDYCGTVVDCAYWPAEDQPGSTNECGLAQGVQKLRFEYNQDVTITQVRDQQLREQALLLIDEWAYKRIDHNSERGTLVRHDKLRLDQGFTDGRTFAIILMQKYDNLTIAPATGSTVAKVLLPTDTTLNPFIVRRAMVNSFNRRERVTIRI